MQKLNIAIAYLSQGAACPHGLFVKIGSYATARVECVCKVEKGDCLIKSGYYLISPLDRLENIQAVINL